MPSIKKFRILKFKSKPVLTARGISKIIDKRVILRNIDKYHFEYIYEYSVDYDCYFRSFILTDTPQSKSFAISNPIWIEIG